MTDYDYPEPDDVPTGPRTLGAISIYRDDVAMVMSASNADLEARVDRSRRHVWYNGAWSTFDIPQTSIAVRTWKGEKMNSFYLSHDGIMLRSDGKTFTGDPVDKDDKEGPNELVMMRNMKRKGDTMIAVGMARMAYEKTLPDGPWRKIDQGMFIPRGQRTKAVGLNDIAFDHQGGLVAVGYKGEIWHRPQGGAWTNMAAPTEEVYLSAVAMHPEQDELTIVGLGGLVLQGSPRAGWSRVANAPGVNFWSVEYFGGAAYIAGNQELFRLRNQVFEPVDFGLARKVSTGRVEASTGQLWSVGGQGDVLYSTDGVTWTALPSPI